MKKKRVRFTRQYFIKKFEAIPEQLWCSGHLENAVGQRCMLGHCGITQLHDASANREAQALARIFKMKPSQLWKINDTLWRIDDDRSPKERVLDALRKKVK